MNEREKPHLRKQILFVSNNYRVSIVSSEIILLKNFKHRKQMNLLGKKKNPAHLHKPGSYEP